MPARRQPTVGFKVHFPFQVSISCWIDLLGYGESLAVAGFNPLDPLATDAVRRLRRFHELVAVHSRRRFPTLVMNDGAVAYRDLTWNTRWTTFEFLTDSLRLFQSIEKAEAADKLPGARMVIATGFRLRGRRAGKDDRGDRIRAVIDALEKGSLTHKEAVIRAAKINLNFDIVPQLQANFAFTRAYVAEQSGARGGLGGAQCFVDLALFEDPLPSWLDIGPPVAWRNDRLQLETEFAPLMSLPVAKEHEMVEGVMVSGGPPGVRNALQVAQHLAKDEDVLTALRRARTSEPKKGGQQTVG